VRQATDLCPSHGNQAVLAEFICEGHFSRHIRKMRQVYSERRRVLVEEIEGALGDCCKILGGGAGLHLTLSIGEGLIVALRFVPLVRWQHSAPEIRFRIGNTSSAEIPGAVRLLKKLLRT